MSCPSRWFSWALNVVLSLCERHSRARTSTPRRAASHSSSSTAGPCSASRSAASPRAPAQRLLDGRPVLTEPLVGVAPPVGQEDAVSGGSRLDHLAQPAEV